MNEELFGELHEQEDYGLFGKEHERQQCFLHNVSGSLLVDKAKKYAQFIYDEGYSDPMYQPEVTQSIIDFKAGFNACVVLLKKAYELIPDGTSHENLIEIKQALFSNDR